LGSESASVPPGATLRAIARRAAFASGTYSSTLEQTISHGCSSVAVRARNAFSSSSRNVQRRWPAGAGGVPSSSSPAPRAAERASATIAPLESTPVTS
jgi:hypothetical protein